LPFDLYVTSLGLIPHFFANPSSALGFFSTTAFGAPQISFSSSGCFVGPSLCQRVNLLGV